MTVSEYAALPYAFCQLRRNTHNKNSAEKLHLCSEDKAQLSCPDSRNLRDLQRLCLSDLWFHCASLCVRTSALSWE